MDWHASGRTDVFRYYRVSWPDFQEVEEVSSRVSDVTVEENSLSQLKASGTATIRGGWDGVDDMLRVYSVSSYAGDVETVCHGTFVVSASTDDAVGAGDARSKASLYSTLQVLKGEALAESVVVERGVDPVARAAGLCSERLLPVQAAAYGRGLEAPVAMDAGDTVLDLVNALLSAAGYESACVNSYGWVVMRPYADPSGKSPVAVFGESGGSAVVSPSWQRSRSSTTVYNLVTFVGSGEDGAPVVASAANDDPNSRWSRVSRRKTVSYFEEVSEAVTPSQLQAKARAKLRESTTSVETVRLTHNWEPYDVGDAVSLDFPRDGAVGTYYSKSRKTSMRPGMPCTAEVRRMASLEGM